MNPSVLQILKDLNSDPKPKQTSSFETIWEKNGPWPGGRGLLSDIIRFNRNRGLKAYLIHEPDTRINITFDLPRIIGNTDRAESIFYLVPSHLQDTFLKRSSYAIQSYTPLLKFDGTPWLGKPINDVMAFDMSRTLTTAEMERALKGETLWWQHLALLYGFDPDNLPEAAGLAA